MKLSGHFQLSCTHEADNDWAGSDDRVEPAENDLVVVIISAEDEAGKDVPMKADGLYHCSL